MSKEELEKRIELLEEQVSELQELLVLMGIATYEDDTEEDEAPKFYS